MLDGYGTLFAPGDWVGLAQVLADGPAVGAAGHPRHAGAEALLERYSRVGRGRAAARGLRRPPRAMTADVVVVTWNAGERVAALPRARRRRKARRTRPVSCDNASDDDTVERIRGGFPG